MNFDRIRPSIDVDRMQQSHATVVGGAYGLTQDLVRCGLGSLTYVDFDVIDASNPARQDFNMTDLGQHKAEALAATLKRINPDVEVNYLIRDFCDIGQDEFDVQFGHTDLFIFATDFFPAQARGNLQALRLRKPAVWIGLYRGGRAGEVVHWVPGVTPACFRCICSSRYRAFAAQARGTASGTHIPSTGGTIFDLHVVDAIAGQVALGILTAGAENRMGRLIQQLGNRNLLQIKIDPEYRLGEKDIFAQYLGDHPANFSFTTIALPMEPERDCPDCAMLRQARHATRLPWSRTARDRGLRSQPDGDIWLSLQGAIPKELITPRCQIRENNYPRNVLVRKIKKLSGRAMHPRILVHTQMLMPDIMLFTEAQAAREAQVDRRTIRRLIQSGRLRAIDVGCRGRRHYRIAADDLRHIAPGAATATAITPPPPVHRHRRRASSVASSVAAYLPSV